MAEPAPSGRAAGGRAPEDDLAAELRRHAARLLPAAMVPSLIVELPELPRTPSGKLDRAALPAPDAAHGPARAEPGDGREPGDEREAALAEIFAEVLGLPAVGADDDFFRLGGTSVHAVRALARMSGRFGTRVPPLRFFQEPTVRRLARVLREGAGS
ncbi:phosphopantetheine-binding protein [Actinomadura sp. NPDC048394]|uniref:phosphopantetheine-binding protein n=1 Tax=Actinomadura sp. NPDC048394 TaxID=3158223 RepID=UPI0033FDD835